MKKINFVIPKASLSGGLRVIYELSDFLVEKGYDVRIYYPLFNSGFLLVKDKSFFSKLKKFIYNILKPNRYQAHWFKFGHYIKFKKIIFLYPYFLLKYFIRDADTIIATSWETAYPVSILPDTKGEKFYFIQHYEIWPLWDDEKCWCLAEQLSRNNPSINMANIEPETTHLKAYKYAVDKTYNLTFNNILTSSWEKRVIAELGSNYCGSIDYGVNFNLFYPDCESRQTTIIGLYRNKHHKGDSELVESFIKLKNLFPELNFIMFGPTKPLNFPIFIEFHVNPEQNLIRTLYSRSDIMIFPSWVEGWGMPPMEAMACKTALISTDVGAVRDYTPMGGVEFIPIRNSNAIVEKAKNLLHEPQKIEHMKNINYQYIQHFTWQRAADQFEKIILKNSD